MGKDIRRIIGCPDGLQFELEIAENEKPQGLAWGKGVFSVKGEPLWVTEAENGSIVPVEWSWLDLLEFLADFWPWLMLEELYPIPVNPSELIKLKEAAERRWEELSDAIVDAEDEELVCFQHRHDLSMAMKGIYLPAVLLLRQGQLFQIGIPEWNKTILLPFAEVKTVLEEIGNFIAFMVKGSPLPRALEAVSLWEKRNLRMQQKGLMLRSGLNAEEMARMQSEVDLCAFWEYAAETGLEDSELLALGIEEKREIIEAIRALPCVDTPALNVLAKEVASIEFNDESRPFEQGYILSGWLRKRLDISESAVADPERILQSWGVIVQDTTLMHAGAGLDAIATWGEKHGPAVLINTAPESMAIHEHRRRTSLAHEICHLLVDRDGALPLAEVLGGRTPERIEQRARAFAAEFLLPRSVADDAVRFGEDLEKVIAELCGKYCLSRELVAWQITNAEAYYFLNAHQRGCLERMRKA
jgi:Zn-dependent peptidase ImmA (M78 family)